MRWSGVGAAVALFAAGLVAEPVGAQHRLTTRIDGPARAVLSEPDIAVNPIDPREVIVVSKDITARGEPALDAFRSSDGGASFSGGRLVAGSYLGVRADSSDPVVAFDRAGTAFFGQLVWRYPGRGFESSIGVQRSDDGGTTFASPVQVVRTVNRRTPIDFGAPPDPSVTHDKEWLAVDRTGGARDGTIYAAWVRIRIARGRQRNRIVVARSVDGGASFSRPRFISRAGRLAVGPQVAVGRGGTVHVAWASFRRTPTERRATVLSARSTDGARGFSVPRRVARFKSGLAAEVLVALDASTSGRLLACWSRARGRRSSQTVCARSRTGRRWSGPVVVAPRVGGAHRLVAIAADGRRRFWISFYAMRGPRTTVRLYRSGDGGRRFQLASVLARRRSAFGFVGDYSGLDVASGRVHAAYALPRGGRGTPNAIYVTSLPANDRPAAGHIPPDAG
jgi:hypothetical protein